MEQAVALVGNNGLTRRYPLERHYRDVLCARVHTPQDDSIVAVSKTAGPQVPPGILKEGRRTWRSIREVRVSLP